MKIIFLIFLFLLSPKIILADSNASSPPMHNIYGIRIQHKQETMKKWMNSSKKIFDILSKITNYSSAQDAHIAIKNIQKEISSIESDIHEYFFDPREFHLLQCSDEKLYKNLKIQVHKTMENLIKNDFFKSHELKYDLEQFSKMLPLGRIKFSNTERKFYQEVFVAQDIVELLKAIDSSVKAEKITLLLYKKVDELQRSMEKDFIKSDNYDNKELSIFLEKAWKQVVKEVAEEQKRLQKNNYFNYPKLKLFFEAAKGLGIKNFNKEQYKILSPEIEKCISIFLSSALNNMSNNFSTVYSVS